MLYLSCPSPAGDIYIKSNIPFHTTNMMGSRYAPRFGVSLGLGILRESWKALIQSNMEFPEVFEDYEKYHSTVNTGNLSRARLVEDWIELGATGTGRWSRRRNSFEIFDKK